MVDAEARKELAAALHRLLCGEMTTDEFTCRYLCDWSRSPDDAVAVIGNYGWCLYGDGYGPDRLRGRHAVPAEVRRMSGRAVLFLSSGLEYGWPTRAVGPMPLWAVGLLGLVAALLMRYAGRSAGLGACTCGLAGMLAGAWAAHGLLTRRRRTEDVRRYYASGDHSVWPFLCAADFERARGRAEEGGVPPTDPAGG